MHNAGPIFDPATRYRIEVRGQVDVDWLQSFEDYVEISVDQSGQAEDTTVLIVQADQSGILGLIRKLHGLGMTIQKFQVASGGGKAAEVDEQSEGPAAA